MEKDKENATAKKSEPILQITKILSEVLDTSTVDPLPSTSKSTDNPQLSETNEGKPPKAVSSYSKTSPDTKLQGNDLPEVHAAYSSAKAGENKLPEIPFETCTVKDMLTEILDCTVVRKPSIMLPPGVPSGREMEPTEFFLDPKTAPKQVFNVRCGSDESACTKRCHTVKQVLNEILDYSVFRRAIQSTACRSPTEAEPHEPSRPGTSVARPEYLSQGELGGSQREYEVYRALGAGVIRSTSALQRPSMVSMGKLLPSYSTVIKMGPPPKLLSFHSSSSFIPRLPPPSYAEVEGLWENNPSLISSESVVFGPDPTYTVCPRCRVVVVTDIQTERSNITHLVALVMCLFLCWPCCLLPYCLKSCNYTYHSCPNCNHYFGMYRPF